MKKSELRQIIREELLGIMEDKKEWRKEIAGVGIKDPYLIGSYYKLRAAGIDKKNAIDYITRSASGRVGAFVGMNSSLVNKIGKILTHK